MPQNKTKNRKVSLTAEIKSLFSDHNGMNKTTSGVTQWVGTEDTPLNKLCTTKEGRKERKRFLKIVKMQTNQPDL